MHKSKPRRLRIAFFGLPLAALLLARDGHDIVLCAVCRRNAIGLRRARQRLGDDRVLVKPDAQSPALASLVQSLQPDLLVSWFWTTRLPMVLVQASRLGGVGVHPSLLPRHRGADPTTWAILSGDEVTGVTVHRIEEGYDTGDILAQQPLRIDPSWTAWQLARALDRPSLQLLRETVSRLGRGESVLATAQEPRLATEAPELDEEACAIRWHWPTERVLRHVRALAPTPGAWTEIDGTLVTLLRAAAAPQFPEVLRPGEGVVSEGKAIVRTGDTAVVILEGEIDGTAATADDLSGLFRSRLPFLVP
jgi:methionyl-tRNA formyltransferase